MPGIIPSFTETVMEALRAQTDDVHLQVMRDLFPAFTAERRHTQNKCVFGNVPPT